MGMPDENDPTGKKKAVPIHYPTHYWFRGEQLSKLTAFEYAAMVQIIPHKQTLEDDILETLDGSAADDFDEREALQAVVASMHGKPGRPTRKIFKSYYIPILEYTCFMQCINIHANVLIKRWYIMTIYISWIYFCWCISIFHFHIII